MHHVPAVCAGLVWLICFTLAGFVVFTDGEERVLAVLSFVGCVMFAAVLTEDYFPLYLCQDYLA